MPDCDAIREQLSAYLDGELTQQQRQRIAVHLEDCADCRRIYEDFRTLRQQVRELDWPQPADEERSRLMARLAFQATRSVGWLLWIAGLMILAGYAGYEFLRGFTFASAERVGVLALILGVVLVFLTVLIERVRDYPHDRYKDVEK